MKKPIAPKIKERKSPSAKNIRPARRPIREPPRPGRPAGPAVRRLPAGPESHNCCIYPVAFCRRVGDFVPANVRPCMKKYLPSILAVVCVALLIAFIAEQRSATAQHDTDTAAITDFSNQVDSATMQVAFYTGTLVIFSNNLAASQSAVLTFSNQLTDAQASLAQATVQLTNLTQQVAQTQADNQALGQRLADLGQQLTNEVATLTDQLTLTQTNLEQANHDYLLLDNRFRRNVAERLVLERKYRNPTELQAQLDRLKYSPYDIITADKIYADLNVEVTSNVAHVITPY